MNPELQRRWQEHSAATGHLDGETERLVTFEYVACRRCAFVASIDVPQTAPILEERPPSMTLWQEDLEAQHLRDLTSD